MPRQGKSEKSIDSHNNNTRKDGSIQRYKLESKTGWEADEAIYQVQGQYQPA